MKIDKKTEKVLKNTTVYGSIGTLVMFIIYYLLYGFPIYAGVTFILLTAFGIAFFMYSLCFYLYYLLEFYRGD